MKNINVLIAESSPLYKKMFTQAVLEINKDASVFFAEDTNKTIGLIVRKDLNILIVNAELLDTDLTRILNSVARTTKAFILITTRPSKIVVGEQNLIPSAEYMRKPIYESYAENFSQIKYRMADVIKKAIANTRFINEIKKQPVIRQKIAENFRPEIVLIASSTGGPKALEIILTKLSENFPVPILIVQHITPQFTETLAKRLNHISRLNVKVAEEGEIITSGTVYLAPGAIHMRINKNNKVRLDNSPAINGVRPAAEILFESVAEDFRGECVLVVILTGMGSDGTDGIVKLKESKKCFCITQSEETCIVYGMPRTVVEKDLSDKIVDIEKISSEIEGFEYVS